LLVVALIVLALLVRARVLPRLEAGRHLEAGAQHLQAGRLQEAEAAWLAAKQLTPDNPNVWRGLSALYRAQGRMPEAHEAVNRLADLVPKEPHLLCEFVAEELRRSPQGMYEATARDAERAATLEPNCVRALTLAGETAKRKGDDKRAIAYLRRAAQVKPEDVPLTLHLINTMLEANDAAGALETAQELTRRYPGYAQGYALIGVAAGAFPKDRLLGHQVEEALKTALRLEPTNALAHARLGQFYNTGGDPRRALPHLQAALLLYYDRTSLLFQLSQAYRAQGDTAAAERLFRAFQRISAQENQLSALQKQSATTPGDSELALRARQTTDALAEARRFYAEERARLLRELAPNRPRPAGGPNS
jgi:predicted Zn-dependent protease